jgi:ribosomal protein L37E
MEITDQTEPCAHPGFGRVKVIDKLGPMYDTADGAAAKVIAWHWVCRVCGATIPKEEQEDKQ